MIRGTTSIELIVVDNLKHNCKSFTSAAGVAEPSSSGLLPLLDVLCHGDQPIAARICPLHSSHTALLMLELTVMRLTAVPGALQVRHVEKSKPTRSRDQDACSLIILWSSYWLLPLDSCCARLCSP